MVSSHSEASKAEAASIDAKASGEYQIDEADPESDLKDENLNTNEILHYSSFADNTEKPFPESRITNENGNLSPNIDSQLTQKSDCSASHEIPLDSIDISTPDTFLSHSSSHEKSNMANSFERKQKLPNFGMEGDKNQNHSFTFSTTDVTTRLVSTIKNISKVSA